MFITQHRYQFQKISFAKCGFFLLAALLPACLVAQKDSTKKQAIDITSAYRPTLRSATKINFSGSQLSAALDKQTLQYNIPSQNLFYAYQPVSLRPLALAQDSNIYLGDRNYVKAGFGNLNTPYLKAGISLGDGKTSLFNITGSYISSNNKNVAFQKYSQLNVSAGGSYFLPKNEVYGKISFLQNKWNRYGYNNQMFTLSKADVIQNFQDIVVTGGYKNTTVNAANITYNPNAEISLFTSKDKLTETTIKLMVPVEKRFEGSPFSLKVDVLADLTQYSTKNLGAANTKFSNNVVQIAPAFEYKGPLLKINGGITPVLDNGDWEILPNLFAEAQLENKGIALQAGWVGRLIKNTYKNLSAINPYLIPIDERNNTKEVEYYGGLKASFAKHFTVSAKAGLVKYNNLPLFINDTTSRFLQNDFKVSNERKINNFRIHADLGYTNQDQFSITGGFTLNAYTGLQDNARAYHTLPLEITGAMRWWAEKRLLLKADFYSFGGPRYLEKGNTSKTNNGGTDLSLGAEYKVNKQFSIWIDGNNLLNDKYERWHNYPVFGVNVVGGILIHF